MTIKIRAIWAIKHPDKGFLWTLRSGKPIFCTDKDNRRIRIYPDKETAKGFLAIFKAARPEDFKECKVFRIRESYNIEIF